MLLTSRAPRVFNRWGRGALRAVSGLVCAAAASMATAQVPKVLVIGDVRAAGSYLSQPYADAAYNEMVAAVTALGGSATDVTQKNFDITGASGNPTTVTATDFVAPGGGGYDIVVLTAVFGGFNASSVSAVQSAVQTRAARSFFLFPDQCSACAPNIAQITQPIINAATGWGISTGVLFNNSSLTPTPGTVVLNGSTPLASSFSSLDPMTVYDYRALNNVPAYNALYMPPQAPSPGDPSPRPPILMPTPADVANNIRVDNVSALIVPRAQSFGGNGACIFTISDVNPLTLPGNPPVGRLGSILTNVAMSATGSCAAQSGSIEILKTLAPLPAGAPVAWPQNYSFTATCDLPTAGSTYTATTSFNAPGSQTATIPDVPRGAVCSLSEAQPAAPAGYTWDTAAFSPASVTVAEGQSAVSTITNTLRANATPLIVAPVPSNTPAGLAAMAALIAVFGIRRSRQATRTGRGGLQK